MEHWKEIAGYEGLYEVSDAGRVRSLNYKHTGVTRIMKPTTTRKGYLLVKLWKDRKHKFMLVHRLVAQEFIPNPLNLDTVNHKDENKLNNSSSNLEWMSMKDNINYGTRNKRAGESLSKKVKMFDKFTGELLATFPSLIEAERVTGIANTHISACCLGKLKSAGGYIWRYV